MKPKGFIGSVLEGMVFSDTALLEDILTTFRRDGLTERDLLRFCVRWMALGHNLAGTRCARAACEVLTEAASPDGLSGETVMNAQAVLAEVKKAWGEE